ncbi:UvrD/REP helicase N-terminal domain-containing protein [Lentzea albidocapillata subsp. violacea]|uniref:DNA 3'-5' helicase n=1 Tax=Lentzea albidocapillata subsp. violacea TaxID=128104 RepID=A0A1G8XHR8_9PSEU|nr:UvrD-helicase domain-containing protein [Lentzea albidocapillata]SDJ90023.1 UvrD/REP helicase N-terminal domain-containing protein [Lentzea albidocapillata subsp. violacea]
MITTEDVGFELTSHQLTVVTSAWDTKQLVTAPAGGGKTTTLCLRIGHLIAQEGLRPAEIVVLTFSRAAVRRLRMLLSRTVPAGRRVRVQTFDSWATSLLIDLGYEQDELAGLGFDVRIERAATVVEDVQFEDLGRVVPRHVVIDEVQDLIGIRRDMVESLLDRVTEAGFTVVGDPAQSIYGFQVPESKQRAEEVGRFFEWVRATYGDDLTERKLSGNFRAVTDEARVALKYGPRLRELTENPAVDPAPLLRELRTALLNEVLPVDGLDTEFVQQSLRSFDGTVAVLARDNAEVLSLSEQLGRHGIAHGVQQASRAVGAAPTWIVDLLHSTGAGVLDRAGFDAVRPDVAAPGSLDETEVWELLRGVAGAPRNRLDLGALRRVVSDGRLPDELTARGRPKIVVSTVHRAKGLEFDRVLISGLTESSVRVREPDPADEARLLYVAMTRAREDMYRLPAPDTRHLRKGRTLFRPVGRWFVGGFQHFVRVGIEGLDQDVCHQAPVGATSPDVDAVGVQRYLLDVVSPGDEVILQRLHDLPIGNEETPPYGIFHNGTLIGEASQVFRHDLWRLLKLSSTYQVSRWPCLVTGLHVDCVEAVVGSPAITERNGLGDHGVWVAPRIFGLGRFDWTHAEQVPEGHDHL